MAFAVETTVDFAPGLEKAFDRPRRQQHDHLTLTIRGEIPDFVLGSLYLNGPALFQFENGLRYRHWLDGDGMVVAVHFEQGRVSFASKYVQGKKFTKERMGSAEEQPVYRTFGTTFSGDRLKRGLGTESPYNVSVFPYRDTLLAFGEQSLPMQLDPVSLETITPGKTFTFGGALNDAMPFSAHPKIDADGELLNFGIFFDPRQPWLVYYRIDERGKLACRKRLPIDYPYSIHDFAASENHVVFHLSPYLLDAESLVAGGRSTMESLHWRPDLGSQMLVLCRETGAELARIPHEPRYCLHTINAFERDGALIVDLIEFERPVYDQYHDLPKLFEEVPWGQPVRFRIDLSTQSLLREESISYVAAPDFPCFDTRRESSAYDELWMLGISAAGRPGRKFFDRLIHARWSTPNQVDAWECPRGHYLGGEPVFVADPNHANQGVVICHIFDSTRLQSRFELFEARDVSAGPIASVLLPEAIHLGFHASFKTSAQNP